MNASLPAAIPCSYCGLPVRRLGGGSQGSPATPLYCCFGCRIAASMQGQEGDDEAGSHVLSRLGLAIFLTLNVLVCTMVLWSEDVYGIENTALAAGLHGLLRWLSLVLALPVLWLLGLPLLEHSWASLRNRQVTTDLLLLIGVIAAYAVSIVAVVRNEGGVYFEVACVVLILVTLGRWLEARSKAQASASLAALEKLLPAEVRVQRDGHEEAIPLADVMRGDVLRVLAGERIPCDGVVLRNPVEVDEQMVTGESMPRLREVGGQVWSGTVALSDVLWLRVEQPAATGTLARLVYRLRLSLARKGRYERLADRVTTWFLPLVVVLALTTTGWHTWRGTVDQGILAGLAVLVIACPCALGIATPLASWVALGQAGANGVVVRGGEVLERLATLRAVRLDKTGTLTTGEAAVVGVHWEVAADAERGRQLAVSLAAATTHVLAQSLRQHLDPLRRAEAAKAVTNHVGRGLESTFPDVGTVLLGSQRFLQERHQVLPEPLAAPFADPAATCVGLAWGGRVRGVIELREELRPSAVPALQELLRRGIDVAVLTGDGRPRGEALGRLLNVAVRAECLPEDKLQVLAEVRTQVGPVAMVGDGLNDAAALAAADVGIALGCGADLTRDAADVCILGNDLGQIPELIDLARRTVRTMRVNLFWSLAYNVVGVALACTGRLNPVWAALAMVLSSTFVLGHSLRGLASSTPPPAAGSPALEVQPS